MTYEIRAEPGERRYMAAVEFTCGAEDMPVRLQQAFADVERYAGSTGVVLAGPAVARYTPPQDGVFGVAAGFYVPEPVPGDGHVVCIELPQGDVARTTHTGQYEALPQAYNAIFEWMDANGREPDSIMWEEYHSSPDTPISEARTEIFWPMK